MTILPKINREFNKFTTKKSKSLIVLRDYHLFFLLLQFPFQ